MEENNYAEVTEVETPVEQPTYSNPIVESYVEPESGGHGGLIVAGIAGVVAGGILLWQKWKKRKIADEDVSVKATAKDADDDADDDREESEETLDAKVENPDKNTAG